MEAPPPIQTPHPVQGLCEIERRCCKAFVDEILGLANYPENPRPSFPKNYTSKEIASYLWKYFSCCSTRYVPRQAINALQCSSINNDNNTKGHQAFKRELIGRTAKKRNVMQREINETIENGLQNDNPWRLERSRLEKHKLQDESYGDWKRDNKKNLILISLMCYEAFQPDPVVRGLVKFNRNFKSTNFDSNYHNLTIPPSTNPLRGDQICRPDIIPSTVPRCKIRPAYIEVPSVPVQKPKRNYTRTRRVARNKIYVRKVEHDLSLYSTPNRTPSHVTDNAPRPPSHTPPHSSSSGASTMHTSTYTQFGPPTDCSRRKTQSERQQECSGYTRISPQRLRRGGCIDLSAEDEEELYGINKTLYRGAISDPHLQHQFPEYKECYEEQKCALDKRDVVEIQDDGHVWESPAQQIQCLVKPQPPPPPPPPPPPLPLDKSQLPKCPIPPQLTPDNHIHTRVLHKPAQTAIQTPTIHREQTRVNGGTAIPGTHDSHDTQPRLEEWGHRPEPMAPCSLNEQHYSTGNTSQNDVIADWADHNLYHDSRARSPTTEALQTSTESSIGMLTSSDPLSYRKTSYISSNVNDDEFRIDFEQDSVSLESVSAKRIQHEPRMDSAFGTHQLNQDHVINRTTLRSDEIACLSGKDKVHGISSPCPVRTTSPPYPSCHPSSTPQFDQNSSILNSPALNESQNINMRRRARKRKPTELQVDMFLSDEQKQETPSISQPRMLFPGVDNRCSCSHQCDCSNSWTVQKYCPEYRVLRCYDFGLDLEYINRKDAIVFVCFQISDPDGFPQEFNKRARVCQAVSHGKMEYYLIFEIPVPERHRKSTTQLRASVTLMCNNGSPRKKAHPFTFKFSRDDTLDINNDSLFGPFERDFGGDGAGDGSGDFGGGNNDFGGSGTGTGNDFAGSSMFGPRSGGGGGGGGYGMRYTQHVKASVSDSVPIDETELINLFEELGISQAHVKTLSTNEIDVQALLLLDENHMKNDLELPLGPRVKLLNYINHQKSSRSRPSRTTQTNFDDFKNTTSPIISLEAQTGQNKFVPDKSERRRRKITTHSLATAAAQSQSTRPKNPFFSQTCLTGDLKKSIGQGGFGLCFESTFRDKPVHVKALISSNAADELAAVLALRQFDDHENVVRPLGVLYDFVDEVEGGDDLQSAGPLAFITPMYDMSLREYIKLNNLLFGEKVSLAIGMLSGLDHLHKCGFVHRDVALRNFLANKKDDVVVALLNDFGLCRRVKDKSTKDSDNYYEKFAPSIQNPPAASGTYVMRNEELLAWRWASPETLSSSLSSFKSDLWSAGVTLWELFDGSMAAPFENISDSSRLTELLQDLEDSCDDFPLSLENVPPPIQQIIKILCTYDPSKRPNAENVIKMLKDCEAQDSAVHCDTHSNFTDYHKFASTSRMSIHKKRSNRKTINNGHQ